MTTVGDALVGRLRIWGIDHVFGYPGEALVKSILSGDPAGRDIIRQSFRQKVTAAVRA